MKTSKVFLKTGMAALLLAVTACASTGNDDVTAVPEVAPQVVAQESVQSSILPGSQADLEQNVGHRVFFGYDQYTLTPDAQRLLARQAAWMQQYPEQRIRVSGHCDERGTRDYNLALGARRANATKSYLVGLGIDASRITTISYGKERLIDTRSTPEAWAINRNATTTLVSTGS